MIIYLFVSRSGNESTITSGLLKGCVKYFSEVILDAPAKVCRRIFIFASTRILRKCIEDDNGTVKQLWKKLIT